jgi:hypothetical protein
VRNTVSVIEIVAAGIEMAILPRVAMQAVERNRELVDGRRFGRTGIYLLLGPPADPWRIYVGSAADILDRPRDRDHWDGKPWWSRAVLIFTPDLALGEHEQLEGLVGRALREAGLDAITTEDEERPMAASERAAVAFETDRLPRENPDWLPSQSVRRAVLPAVEAVLHLLGVHVEIRDPYEPAR